MVTREYTFIVGPETATLPTLATPSAGVAAAESSSINNHALTFSVASSAATIALKTRAGTDPTSTDYVSMSFRSATLATGTPITRLATAATSVVLSSGSTLGQVSGQASDIYVYALDNAGTVELAVSHAYFPENALVSTTAEGGAGAADSATVMYSTTARSNVACRLIGVITNTQTTAGTWAQTATKIQLAPFHEPRTVTIQRFTSGSGTYYTPSGVKYLIVRMCGAGGGGSGSGTGSAGSGSSGSSATFGNLTAGGGTGGAWNGSGTAGGAVTIGAGWSNIGSYVGNAGGAGHGIAGSVNQTITSLPGVGPFGGIGVSGAYNANPPTPATANSGAGGWGAHGNNTTNAVCGNSGGGAGFVHAIAAAPDASYAYSVPAATTGGSAGTNGTTGSPGGSGIIIVEEYY